MNRRGGAGEIINLIDFEQDWFSNVVSNQFESRVIQQVHDVVAATSKEIVEAENFVTFANQPVAKMRSQEPCTACYQHSHGASKLPLGG